MILTILIFIIVLGILVFVHELGHFVMAKRAGMKVEEFGFGFPPRMFGVRRGDTIYSVNWIPLGGFVKIAGEDGGNLDNPESFSNKSAWQRFAVLIAGVTMNILFAWLIFSLILGIGKPTGIGDVNDLPKSARVENIQTVLTGIAADSPAEQAGWKVGDAIISVNNEPINSTEEFQRLTRENAGKETSFVIQRGNEQIQNTVTPRANPPEGEGALGVAPGTLGVLSYPWYEVLYRGLIETVQWIWLILTSFVGLISDWVTGKPVSDISGPVGIAVITRDVAALGFVYLLQFTAILSINLAVINAVPFPALDGGRILFLIIEKIRGRKLPETAEGVANTLGFALLMLLMVFVTVKDFGRFEIIDKVKNLF